MNNNQISLRDCIYNLVKNNIDSCFFPIDMLEIINRKKLYIFPITAKTPLNTISAIAGILYSEKKIKRKKNKNKYAYYFK